MSNAALPTPPMLEGQDVRELVAVRRYLFRLVEQLNLSLNSLDISNFTPQAIEKLSSVPQQTKDAIYNTQSDLKSLIIKNAKEVTAEIQEITDTLESNYLAVSDFGQYKEDVLATFRRTASDAEQAIEFNATVNEFMTTSNGYIRQGIIGFNGITPVIGIAIGQNIRTVTVTHEGQEYEVIDTSQNMSVWTTEKLSFYVNGSEVAYFANNALTVNEVATEAITVLGKWSITASNGLTFRWIGGEE